MTASPAEDPPRRSWRVSVVGNSLPILIIPLLTPRLSSHWLSFVTDVNTATARNLVDSMSNEVVVSDNSIRDIVPGEPLTYDEAVGRALAARRRRSRM